VILYTPLPLEVVMGSRDERSFLEFRRGPMVLLVEPLDHRQGRLMAVVSTDPSHFLLKGLQPGDTISLAEVGTPISQAP
jgi:hypothetical protein